VLFPVLFNIFRSSLGRQSSSGSVPEYNGLTVTKVLQGTQLLSRKDGQNHGVGFVGVTYGTHSPFHQVEVSSLGSPQASQALHCNVFYGMHISENQPGFTHLTALQLLHAIAYGRRTKIE